MVRAVSLVFRRQRGRARARKTLYTSILLPPWPCWGTLACVRVAETIPHLGAIDVAAIGSLVQCLLSQKCLSRILIFFVVIPIRFMNVSWV